MTLTASIHRFSSIGLALARPHFHPPSSPFLIVRVTSWFRICKYDAKSTSTVYDCVHPVLWTLFSFKPCDMDFISIFVDQSGPRPVLNFTIHRKIRHEAKVPEPKYRFLSIARALLWSHFLSLCGFFPTLPFGCLAFQSFNHPSSPSSALLRSSLASSDLTSFHHSIHSTHLSHRDSFKPDTDLKTNPASYHAYGWRARRGCIGATTSDRTARRNARSV